MFTGPPAPGTPTDTSLDYGLYNGSMVVSRKTGKPWNGKEPRSGKMFKQGIEVPDVQAEAGVKVPYSNEVINPNDPTQRYKPVDIVKSPDISAATSDLLETFKKSANDSLKDFSQYLQEFKANTGAALDASKAAVAGIPPTINTLNANQGKYNADLAASLAAHDAALEKSKAEYEALNAANAATQRGIVEKGYNELPSYDKAGNAIAERQMQEVLKNVSRYKLGTGTPTSLGGDESRILAQGAADVMLPLKQSQIARRYDLFGNEANVERGLYGNEQNRVATFNPYVAAQEFAAQQGTAQQQFQSGQATAQTIQALRERVAGLTYQQALQFFNLIGVPEQIRAQVLGEQINNLGKLAQLEDQSRYRSLQDKLGANLSQPQYFGFSAPGFPAPPRYNNSPPYVPPIAPPSTATLANPRRGNEPIVIAPNYGYTGERGYVPSQYNRNLGGLDLGPDNQFYRTQINPATGMPISVPVTGTNINLPNNYDWGRSAADQEAYAAAQQFE